ARECGRRLGGVGLPERVQSAVFGFVDVVKRDARASGIVLARPLHGEAGYRFGGREGTDAAGGRNRVDRDEGLLGRVDALGWVLIVHLIGGDGLAEDEYHQGDVADLGAGGQAGVGTDGETDQAGSTAGAVFGGQEARQEVRGRQVRGGIDRLERGREDPRGRVQVEANDDLEVLVVFAHVHGRVVVLAAGRNRDVRAAESDGRKLECAPVQVGIERVGDVDLLRWGCGRGIVLEVDLVGELASVGDKIVLPTTGGAVQGVGVLRRDGGSRGAAPGRGGGTGGTGGTSGASGASGTGPTPRSVTGIRTTRSICGATIPLPAAPFTSFSVT